MGSIPTELMTSSAMNQYNLFFCADFQSAAPFQQNSQIAKNTSSAIKSGESGSAISWNAI